MQASDRELLERFAAGRDEAAFRVLVERYLAMVLGVARRVTANEDLARDVAQNAFVRLAERAALIPEKLTLSAWLHRVTQHLAIDLVRSEERRRKRELANHDPHAMDNTPEPDWSAMAPVVDALVNRLPAADREVLLLRYYRNEPHAAVARQLGLNEEAAKKRAARALEKLRALLAKQGIATSAVALATLLPAQAAPPIPGSLVLIVTAAAKNTIPIAPQILNLHLAMSTAQKSAIAVAALVFMSSLGYAFRSSSEDPEADGSHSVAALENHEDRSSARTRNERRNPASSAERLERLRSILAITSRVEQPRQMLIFIGELAPDQFEETAGQLQVLGVKTDSNNFRLFLSAWTKRHPLGAAGWAKKTLGGEIPQTILKTWGENDPAAAIDWVTRNLPGATGHDAQARQPLVQVLASLALKDPAAAVKALDVIPGENDRIVALRSIVAKFGLDDLERVLAVLGEGPQRSAIIAASLKTFGDYNQHAKAFELLLSDKDARQRADIESFFADWDSDPDLKSAIAAIEKLPEAKAREQAKAGILTRLGNYESADAVEFLDRHPEWTSDPLMLLVGDRCGPQLGAELSLRMQDRELRERTLTRNLQEWLGSRESSARKCREWMGQHEIPQSVREALETQPPENR
ncbi:RNA polymerase sigma factor [Haloferula sp. BvORR071]|uniref:RNA polymerase sigma factor n=1 Tax=Haloferula sp. BvORR071 TaxID=1396141 RepID=UPI0005598FE0|nr:RNA polymerase sigma factor [Haloferula sp. BvORR071]